MRGVSEFLLTICSSPMFCASIQYGAEIFFKSAMTYTWKECVPSGNRFSGGPPSTLTVRVYWWGHHDDACVSPQHFLPCNAQVNETHNLQLRVAPHLRILTYRYLQLKLGTYKMAYKNTWIYLGYIQLFALINDNNIAWKISCIHLHPLYLHLFPFIWSH